jgi:hypothetical protein
MPFTMLAAEYTPHPTHLGAHDRRVRTCWYYFEDIHEKCVLNALNKLYCTVGGGAEDD